MRAYHYRCSRENECSYFKEGFAAQNSPGGCSVWELGRTGLLPSISSILAISSGIGSGVGEGSKGLLIASSVMHWLLLTLPVTVAVTYSTLNDSN